MRFIISIGLAILLTSCAATTANYYTRTVESWRRGNVNTLYKRWGVPDARTTSLEGDTIYIYKSESYRHSSAGMNGSQNGRSVISTDNIATAGHRGTLPVSCITAFIVNRNGIITGTEVKGNGCYGGENFVHAKANPNVAVVSP